VILPIATVTKVSIVSDRETLRVGPLAVTAHATPGHTPGGTSWTWRSCAGVDCIDFVYADSLTAVSADGFLFTRSREYPNAVADFERSFRTLESLSCGILLTPHPEASRPLTKDPDACRKYVDSARERLRKRLATETSAP
jgi:metallo-beta-lactamase class B